MLWRSNSMKLQLAADIGYSKRSASCCPLHLLIWKIVSDCFSYSHVLTLPWVSLSSWSCSILSSNCLTISINSAQNSQRQINSMHFFSLPVSHPSPSSPSYAIFIFITALGSGLTGHHSPLWLCVCVPARSQHLQIGTRTAKLEGSSSLISELCYWETNPQTRP